MTRSVLKSLTVGVEDTTLDDFSEVATLVGAPADARVTTSGGPVYDPATGTHDTAYPHSVTFTWVDQV